MDLDTHENPFIYFTTILDLFLQFCSKDVTIYTVEFTFFFLNPITILKLRVLEIIWTFASCVTPFFDYFSGNIFLYACSLSLKFSQIFRLTALCIPALNAFLRFFFFFC